MIETANSIVAFVVIALMIDGEVVGSGKTNAKSQQNL